MKTFYIILLIWIVLLIFFTGLYEFSKTIRDPNRAYYNMLHNKFTIYTPTGDTTWTFYDGINNFDYHHFVRHILNFYPDAKSSSFRPNSEWGNNNNEVLLEGYIVDKELSEMFRRDND